MPKAEPEVCGYCGEPILDIDLPAHAYRDGEAIALHHASADVEREGHPTCYMKWQWAESERRVVDTPAGLISGAWDRLITDLRGRRER